MEKDTVVIDIYDPSDSSVSVYLYDLEDKEIADSLGTYSLSEAQYIFDIVGEIIDGKVILEGEDEEEDYSEFSLVDEDD